MICSPVSLLRFIVVLHERLWLKLANSQESTSRPINGSAMFALWTVLCLQGWDTFDNLVKSPCVRRQPKSLCRQLPPIVGAKCRYHQRGQAPVLAPTDKSYGGYR